MTAAERRQAILEALCMRRHETRENLANEFGVSKRTIEYDVLNLMLTSRFLYCYSFLSSPSIISFSSILSFASSSNSSKSMMGVFISHYLKIFDINSVVVAAVFKILAVFVFV